jgi:hypothetical protein
MKLQIIAALLAFVLTKVKTIRVSGHKKDDG